MRVALTPGERRIAARLVLYVLVTLSILTMPSFRDSTLSPLVRGSTTVGMYLRWLLLKIRGAVAFINISVAIAHIYLDGVRLR